MTYQIPLTIAFDSIFDIWMVRQASHAFAASHCPAFRVKNGERNPVTYEFETKAEALEQVRRLNKWLANGGTLEYRHHWTDGLFETVADTKYGAAWN